MTAARSIIRFQRNDTLSVAMLSYGLDKGPALDLLERAERYPIAAIALRAIRARAAIPFLKSIDSAVNSPCFSAFLLPLGAPPAAPCIRHTLAPLTAGARHCNPLRFDLARHRNARRISTGAYPRAWGSFCPFVSVRRSLALATVRWPPSWGFCEARGWLVIRRWFVKMKAGRHDAVNVTPPPHRIEGPTQWLSEPTPQLRL